MRVRSLLDQVAATHYFKREQLLVWVIFVLALLVRLDGIRFGLPALNDPDELMFEMGAVRMLTGGTLNPGWFGHPATTTMYLLALINGSVYLLGYGMGWFTDPKAFLDAIYTDPSWAIIPGRVAMVLFGVWCVGLTFRIGKALFGPACGMVAATLLALSPVHASYSQIIRSDIMATAFMLLVILAAIRISHSGRWRDVIMAGIWLGFAVATKWPFAAAAFGVMGAIYLYALSQPGRLIWALTRLAAFALVAIAALLIISPYLVLDFNTALRDVLGESQLKHVGANGGTPWWNARWYLSGPLVAAVGYAGVALTVWGLMLTLHEPRSRAILLPVLACFFLITVMQRLVWVRWILPLLPIVAIIVAVAAMDFVRRVRQLWPNRATIAIVATATMLLLPLAIGVRANGIERSSDSRQLATQWADQHIPPGSTIIIEHFGFDLISKPWNYLFPLAEAGCVDARELLSGKVQYAAIQAKRGGHHNIDYGTLALQKRGTCAADYAIISQHDRYLAEADLFPDEVASYRELVQRSTLVATIRPRPGVVGGPLIRIFRIERQPAGATDPVRHLPSATRPIAS